jgi:hypothetical protein
MTSMSAKPELGSLEHYGVMGMKWGRHRAKADAYDIRTARASVAGKEAKYRQAVRKASKMRDTGEARAAAMDKAKQMKVDLLKDPDRVIAARLTRGEKAVTILLGVGIPAIAITSAHSRRIERKQEKGKYDN